MGTHGPSSCEVDTEVCTPAVSALRPGIVDPTRRYPAVPSAVFVTPMPKVVPSYTSIAPRRTRASLGMLDTRIRDSSSRSLL